MIVAQRRKQQKQSPSETFIVGKTYQHDDGRVFMCMKKDEATTRTEFVQPIWGSIDGHRPPTVQVSIQVPEVFHLCNVRNLACKTVQHYDYMQGKYTKCTSGRTFENMQHRLMQKNQLLKLKQKRDELLSKIGTVDNEIKQHKEEITDATTQLHECEAKVKIYADQLAEICASIVHSDHEEEEEEEEKEDSDD